MTYKLAIISILLCSFSHNARSQELISNGDFETYRILPRFEGDLNATKEWYTLVNSADYLHTSYGGWMPQFGSAHGGYGYVGLSSYNLPSGASEAFGQEIDSKLVDPSEVYIVEFYGKGSTDISDCAGVSFYSFENTPEANLFGKHISSLTGATHLWTSDAVKDSFWKLYYSCVTLPAKTTFIGVTIDKVANCPQYTYLDDIKITKFDVDLGPDSTLCPGDQIILRSEFPKGTFKWEDGSTNPTHLISKAGTYSLTVTIGSCSKTNEVTFQFHDPKNLKLGNDTILCPGDSMLILTPANADSIRWDNGTDQRQIWIKDAGSYSLTMYSNGCSYRDEINISYSNITPPDLGKDTTLCPGYKIRKSVHQNGAKYLWNTGSTKDYVEITEAGKYWVEVVKDGCLYSDTVEIKNKQTPILSIGDDRQWCIGDTITLQPEVIDTSWRFSWQDGSTLHEFHVTNAGIYVLKALWDCGMQYDSVLIEEVECACKVFIPNAFTPNDLGLNESFGPVFDCHFSSYKFQVYNRWGELIFESNNPNENWSGTYLGTTSPQGVYLYLMEYSDSRKKKYSSSGYFHLLR